MASAIEIVRAALSVMNDVETMLTYFADDAVYHNVPFEPVHGPDGVRQVLAPVVAKADEVQIVIHRELGDEVVVFNERTDRFRQGERWRDIPVTGVWEVHDGKITLWRDYFDYASTREYL
jgi:limonene-1,2-epoxide hydrolase